MGVALRIAVYLQANSMYLDEANVARNVYERSFARLAAPLNYYQYAPVVFLWVVKASTLAGGYGEYAYRVFPLLCGIASLFMLFLVMRHYCGYVGMWYALLLLAVGPVYVEFACVTKQYAPDMFTTLLLLWLALSYRVENTSAFKLFVVWLFAGSLAIWLSMPSVFVLAGVGGYYLLQMRLQKEYGKLWFVFVAGALWLLQFGLYYWFILRPQANSAYLQNYHHNFFFYPPLNLKTLLFDLNLLLNVVVTAGGHQVLSLVLHLGCMVLGIVYLVRSKRAALSLLVAPLVLLFCAAAIRQYSLIPRLLLFAMPLLLILIAVGLEQLLKIRFALARVAILVMAVICIANYNAIKNFVKPMEREEMKQSLAYLKQRGINGNKLYVANLAVPAYVYYTSIHPEKDKWKTLTGGKTVEWGMNVDSLAQTWPPQAVMLYGWEEPAIVSAEQTTIQRYHPLMDSNIVRGGIVYLYE